MHQGTDSSVLRTHLGCSKLLYLVHIAISHNSISYQHIQAVYPRNRVRVQAPTLRLIRRQLWAIPPFTIQIRALPVEEAIMGPHEHIHPAALLIH
jgi:hypothetical protein